MFDKYILGSRIRELRQSYNLSLKDVADALGTKSGSIGNIERGDKSLSIEMLHNLANYFLVSVDYLLGRCNKPQHEEYIENVEKPLFTDKNLNLYYHVRFFMDANKEAHLRTRQTIKEYEEFKKHYSLEERMKMIFAILKMKREWPERLKQHNKAIKDLQGNMIDKLLNKFKLK